jgi:hypothetical protein
MSFGDAYLDLPDRCQVHEQRLAIERGHHSPWLRVGNIV